VDREVWIKLEKVGLESVGGSSFQNWQVKKV